MDRNPRSLADAAIDVHRAPVQREQPFHNREAKPGTVLVAIAGRAGLEVRISDTRQILSPDTNSGV